MRPPSGLTRQEIVEVLCRGASADEAARASACVRGDGNIISDLIAVGFKRSQVLAACAQVTGIKKAPSAWFKEPQPLDVEGIDLALCKRVNAVPIRFEAGVLFIAYGDPATAVGSASHGLPPHTPTLTTPTRVARALRQLAAAPPADDAIHQEPTNVSASSGSNSRDASAVGRSRRKSRKVRRAASQEAAAVVDEDAAPPPPAIAAPAARPQPPSWEQTVELPPAAAAPQAAPVAVQKAIDVRSYASAAGHIAARSHGPLDPPLPPVAAAARPRPSDPKRSDPRKPDPKKKTPRRAAGAPGGADASSSVLPIIVVILLFTVGGVVAARVFRGGPPKQTPPNGPVLKAGKVDLADRQRALVEQASVEKSAVAAINLLTNAINLDPESVVGRDAFFARARRYLGANEFERARRDLVRLQRRADAAPIKGEVDALLADLVRTHGAGSDVAPQAQPDVGTP